MNSAPIASKQGNFETTKLLPVHCCLIVVSRSATIGSSHSKVYPAYIGNYGVGLKYEIH